MNFYRLKDKPLSKKEKALLKHFLPDIDFDDLTKIDKFDLMDFSNMVLDLVQNFNTDILFQKELIQLAYKLNNENKHCLIIAAITLFETSDAEQFVDNCIYDEEKVLKDELNNEIGNFWGILETRYYMRLLFTKLGILLEKRLYSIANKLAFRMLELCTSDNLGIRYVLPSIIVASSDNDGIKKYENYCKKFIDEDFKFEEEYFFEAFLLKLKNGIFDEKLLKKVKKDKDIINMINEIKNKRILYYSFKKNDLDLIRILLKEDEILYDKLISLI